MHFEQLNKTGWAQTYLLVDSTSKSAAIIDPVYDFMDEYLSVIESKGLVLMYAIATHTHADHITVCYSLRESTGCEYAMWKDTPCLGVSHYLNEEDVLMVGSLPLKVHHVPGHTNDHVLIESPTHLLTGDFLFTGAGGAVMICRVVEFMLIGSLSNASTHSTAVFSYAPDTNHPAPR